MKNIKFNYFKINFNSYYPYAYEIQRGNYIHYLPKAKKDKITDSSVILNRKFNPNIIISSNNLKIKDKNTSSIIITSTKKEMTENTKQKVKRPQK